MTNIWEKDKRTIFGPILTLSAPILRHRESLKKASSKNSKKYNERISKTSQSYIWPQALPKKNPWCKTKNIWTRFACVILEICKYRQ